MFSDPLLNSQSVLPIDRPFTRRSALGVGVTDNELARLRRLGLLVSPLRGVFHAAQLPQNLGLRIDCLQLVVPTDAVVTDRTAGWLHGAPMILAPNSHLEVPRVDMFRRPGHRIRQPIAASGQRELFENEVVEVEGIRATSKLRTACDLGRKLPRRQAFAALCSMMKVADFDLPDLCEQADHRFVGHRWVRQLRELIPKVDPRLESPGECNLALIWHDTPGLPGFEPQWPVRGPRGWFYLDLAVPSLRYAAEYDGRQWHGEERQEADLERREWLKETQGWMFGIFVDDDVRGTGQSASDRLLYDVLEARRTLGARIQGAESSPFVTTRHPLRSNS
jgi:hypothetical protein